MPPTMKARAIRMPTTPASVRRISTQTRSRRDGGRAGRRASTSRSRQASSSEEATATGITRHNPSRPKLETICTAKRGPTVRASSPPSMKKLIPRPTEFPEASLMITGAVRCITATLQPTVSSSTVRLA